MSIGPRVSTEEQAKDSHYSLRYQRRACLEYCEGQGYEVWDIVEDAGISGAKETSPGLERLYELAAQGPYVLVAINSDRVSRDKLRYALLKKTIVDAGGRFEYVEQKFDDSPEGELQEDVVVAFNAWWRTRHRISIYNKTREKAVEGKYQPPRAKLGYRWSKLENGRKANGATLQIDAEEAELVNLIFEMYPRMSCRSLAIWLNENGYRFPVKSPKRQQVLGQSRLFTDEDIHNILTDEIYTGTVVWGATSQSKRRKPEPIRHHVPEYQIIDFSTFNAVKALLKQRSLLPAKVVFSTYIFSGLLKCVYCSGSMIGTSAGGKGSREVKPRYRCINYHQYGRQVCRGWQILEETARRPVIDFLVDLFTNKLPMQRYLEDEAKALSQDNLPSREKRAQETIEAAKHEIKTIQELAKKQVYTADEAADEIREIRERIEKAKKTLKSLERQSKTTQEVTDILEVFSGNLADALGKMSNAGLQTLCRQVFKKIQLETAGHARGRQAHIKAYTFTPELQDLLANQIHHKYQPLFEGE